MPADIIFPCWWRLPLPQQCFFIPSLSFGWNPLTIMWQWLLVSCLSTRGVIKSSHGSVFIFYNPFALGYILWHECPPPPVLLCGPKIRFRSGKGQMHTVFFFFFTNGLGSLVSFPRFTQSQKSVTGLVFCNCILYPVKFYTFVQFTFCCCYCSDHSFYSFPVRFWKV